MVKVKICGITNLEDALKAVEFGADAVGFILYDRSKRYISPKDVRHITTALPPFVAKVGVFVNEDPRKVLEILSYSHLDFAQLHGSETPDVCDYIGADRVIKVFRLKSIEEIDSLEPFVGKARAFLLDTYSDSAFGGTGKTFNWDIARAVREKFPEIPLILSGGLNPTNVKNAISQVSPYGIDVSSGVEKEVGKKDSTKMEEFIKVAKCP